MSRLPEVPEVHWGLPNFNKRLPELVGQFWGTEVPAFVLRQAAILEKLPKQDPRQGIGCFALQMPALRPLLDCFGEVMGAPLVMTHNWPEVQGQGGYAPFKVSRGIEDELPPHYDGDFPNERDDQCVIRVHILGTRYVDAEYAEGVVGPDGHFIRIPATHRALLGPQDISVFMSVGTEEHPPTQHEYRGIGEGDRYYRTLSFAMQQVDSQRGGPTEVISSGG